MKLWRWRNECLKPRPQRERFVYGIGTDIRAHVVFVRAENRRHQVVLFRINGVSAERNGARLKPGDQVEILIDHDGTGPVVCLLDLECSRNPFIEPDCIELARIN